MSSENAEARIEHGVLSLRLPKLQGAQARRINVSRSRAGRLPGVPSGGRSVIREGSGRDHTAQGDRVTEESQESFPGQRSAVLDAREGRLSRARRRSDILAR